MIAPEAAREITIGQVWVERDKRHPREVLVVGLMEPDKIRIRHASRDTWASLKRFNGKSGGYTYRGIKDAA